MIRFRAKNGVVFAFALFTFPVIWIFLFGMSDLNPNEETFETKLTSLQDRLQQAETMNLERQNDIDILHRQMLLLLNNHQHNRTQMSGSNSILLSSNMKYLLANMSAGMGSVDIQPPGIFNYLPHLIGKPESLKPQYKISQSRHSASVVIGVPSIKREHSYLIPTLTSLIDSLNEEEMKENLIVVFIAEPWDLYYARRQAKLLKNAFAKHFSSGLLEMIVPPASFYPNLDNLKETFGDSKDRVKWRTKQNLDFSFLMMYARSRGTYYLQLEDDVVTKPNYMTAMKKFAYNQQSIDWILLEFSHLGFIDKLFKSKDLPMVVEFFLMFHRDKPIDWLLDHLFYVKVCNPEKNAKHCQKMIESFRIRYKPSLFQHIGTHSSLKGKVQKLKDKDFGKQLLHTAHVNPEADVSTTIKIYQQYSIERAYVGDTFFWGTIPSPGDQIMLKFLHPIFVDRFLFKSGSVEHPGDKFYNTTIEVLPVSQKTINQDQLTHDYYRKSDGFWVVGNFSQVTGVAEGSVPSALGKISQLRLKVQATSENWVLLNEIHIQTKKKNN